MANKWGVYGLDTFENRKYPIQPTSEFENEQLARVAVRETLVGIKIDQPAEDAGDPFEEGSIQDTVILVHPDGSEEGFTTKDLQ